MNTGNICAALAIAAAAFVASGAAAAGIPAAGNGMSTVYGPAAGVRSAAVTYDDINLASSNGVQVLENRVRHAARLVCATDTPNDLRSFSQSKHCYYEALSDAHDQMAMVIARARADGGDLAMADTHSIRISSSSR